MQERVEVLAWAVNALVGTLLVQSRAVARKLADVGEGVQQSDFRLDQFLVVTGQALTKVVVLREQDACARRRLRRNR